MANDGLSLDNRDPNIYIERAKTLVNRFNAAPLHIVDVQKEYDEKISGFSESGSLGSSSSRQKPSDTALELDAQLTFLRKLKFHYLEQDAKDKYIKTIVKDESDIVTLEDNENLRQKNEVKKAQLKETKERLAQRYKDIENSAVNVESKYKSAEALIKEFSSLTSQILDSRLALSRLRTSFPPPRLSVASAKATLETQIETMATLDTQLSDNASKVEELKERVQAAATDVERTRVERAAKEEEAKQAKAEEDDERISGLYDWYTASLALHRSLFSLDSTTSNSENEISLTYNLNSSTSPDTKGHPTAMTLNLLFHPNTRVLADASISSPDSRLSSMNLNDLIGSHVQNNDVVGLIRGIMARARASLSE